MSKETQVEKIGKKTSVKTALTITIFCLVMLAAVYVCFAYYYMRMIYPKTTINGIDCSEMSVEQAEQLIKEKVEEYSLYLTFRDESTSEIQGENIAYEYVSTGEVQKILENQDVWKWIFYVFQEKEYEVAEAIQFDELLLLDEFYALENISAKTQVNPVDAYVTFEEDSFVIVPEEEGNLIKKNELYHAIRQAISSSMTELNVAELDVYEEPTLREDAAELKQEQEQLNELAAVRITYQLPSAEKILDGNVVRKWLNQDEEGNYSITEKELKTVVTEYVAELASEVNTVGITRKFKSTNRGEIEVSGGSYGYKVNQKSEVTQILEDIANHTVVSREPAYTSKEVTTEAEGLGDTYIEIDLSNQHLWYYIDGELYMDSALVSGTYTVPGRRTPSGVYLLSYKAKNAVLRGALKEDGTYEYESPVTFWMPFNRGIGLHDASWRGSFGGSIYMYSGSHGCINLPYNSAKAIYAKIDKETPIILYY